MFFWNKQDNDEIDAGKEGDKYIYRFKPEGFGVLAKVIYLFNRHYQPIGFNGYKHYSEQERAKDSSEYLRGVAATLPDGERLIEIADFLDEVKNIIDLGWSERIRIDEV